MKHRIKYLALIAILVFSMLVVVGCGIDTATLAGSASGINSTEAEQEEPEQSELEQVEPEDDEQINLEAFAEDEAVVSETNEEVLVWVCETGKCYHSKSSCSRMKNPWQVTLSEALEDDKRACSKCY